MRPTGLLITVRAVLFSISRLRTPAALKAAKNIPLSSSVERPRSIRSTSSSSSVKDARPTFMIIRNAVSILSPLHASAT